MQKILVTLVLGFSLQSLAHDPATVPNCFGTGDFARNEYLLVLSSDKVAPQVTRSFAALNMEVRVLLGGDTLLIKTRNPNPGDREQEIIIESIEALIEQGQIVAADCNHIAIPTY